MSRALLDELHKSFLASREGGKLFSETEAGFFIGSSAGHAIYLMSLPAVWQLLTISDDTFSDISDFVTDKYILYICYFGYNTCSH